MRNSFLLALFAFMALCGSSLPASAQAPFYPCVPSQDRQSCAAEVTPKGVSTEEESGHVVKSTAGDLVGFQVNNWDSTAGVIVMVIDGTAIPSDGTVATCSGTPAQTDPCIMAWYGVPTAPSTSQSTTVSPSWRGGPALHFLNGLVLVCSSTGPVTLTAASTCTFSAEVQ